MFVNILIWIYFRSQHLVFDRIFSNILKIQIVVLQVYKPCFYLHPGSLQSHQPKSVHAGSAEFDRSGFCIGLQKCPVKSHLNYLVDYFDDSNNSQYLYICEDQQPIQILSHGFNGLFTNPIPKENCLINLL